MYISYCQPNIFKALGFNLFGLYGENFLSGSRRDRMKIAEIRENVYIAKEILSDEESIRHKLNIIMSLIRTIAYMKINSLKDSLPNIYSDLQGIYNRLLNNVLAEVQSLDPAQRKVIEKIIDYLKDPQYRMIVALMVKTPEDERPPDIDRLFT